MSLPVEVYAAGRKHQVALHDLSHSGMFLRVGGDIPVGAVVHVAMAPDGADRVLTAGKVVHALDPSGAKTLGRVPGVGIQFRDPVSHRDEQFAEAVAQLIERHAIVVPEPAPPPERVILRGSLAWLGLPTLLTMLEQERKTCRLALTRARDPATGAIELAEGRIVHARSSAAPGARARAALMSLLDWTHGTFEVWSGAPARATSPELATPLTHLLLDHARLRDEASRPHRAPSPHLAAGTDTSFAARAPHHAAGSGTSFADRAPRLTAET